MAQRKRSSNNRAKQFETDMQSMFENIGAWTERFADKMVYRGPDAPPMSVAGPPDLCALHGGHAYLIECKAKDVNQGRSMVFDRLAPHQEESLIKFARAGGRAYVAVLWYGTTNASPNTYAVMIPIATWMTMKRDLGKKSFNIDDLQAHARIDLQWLGRKEGIGPWRAAESQA